MPIIYESYQGSSFMQLHASMLNSLQVKYNRKVNCYECHFRNDKTQVFNLSRLYMNYLIIILCNMICVIF